MNAPWQRVGILIAAILASAPCRAADSPDYLDDRSSAEALVRSLYNAVSRKEYARAWDYFGDTKPAKDFKAFAAGYEKTERVDVETGAVSEEGAAGSLYFQVPVAIRAVDTDGAEHVFTGCYTARLVQPANQEPPFTPLRLEKGSLKPAGEGELADLVPASCGDAPAPPPRDKMRETIEKAFKAAYGMNCQTLRPDAEPGAAGPEISDIAYKDSGGDDRKARLFRFGCITGAYNTSEVYYLESDGSEFRQLQFAEPELDIRYEKNDTEGKLEGVTVTGFVTVDMIANSSYDAQTHTIQSSAKWRGVGDASSAGTYLFRNGAFALTRFDVDASYDGEINPETVVDYDSAP